MTGRLALLSLLATLAISSPAAAAVAQKGYIPMADGAQLAYHVDLPSDPGRFPVAMVYDGYCEGSGPQTCNDPVSSKALLDAGYAVIGVSIRGTNCSTGTFEAFTEQHWRDGAEAVEWAARQPWSNGRVGMFGTSFPGITSVGVAGQRPPHLRAIAPSQVSTDIYSDAGFPGGIQNTGFGAFWAGFNQLYANYSGGAGRALNTSDAGCAQAQVTHAAAEPTQNLAVQGLTHTYLDDYWKARRPGANAARINVPALSCLSWQDDETSSIGSFGLNRVLDPSKTWMVATNGYHGMCELDSPRITAQLVQFFDHFVKGEDNGFDRTPRVSLWHETAKDAAGDNEPSWVTTHKSTWSVPIRPVSLYFKPGGSLSLERPKGEAAPDDYAYPGPSLGNENGIVAGQNNVLWKGQEPQGASLAYTTPALSRDAEFYGAGSANIWLSSTAPDTDLQITLTEVRPDGQETYVVRGWLRASHRTLDEKRSTKYAPYHTHQEADTVPLEAGKATPMRIQLRPFNHVFRKGSSLRLWINAPTGFTGGWSLDFLKTPAINSIYADEARPSALVLGHLRGGRAQAPLPACDTLLNQPCRENQTPVPAGALKLSKSRR